MREVFVAVLKDSDLPTTQATLDVLRQFEIRFEVKVTSAHRTPEAAHTSVTDADRHGDAVYIAAAGMAAHLAGAAAGRERLVAEWRCNAEAIIEKDARLREQRKAEA